MKLFFLPILIVSAVLSTAHSQRQDNVWVLGYNYDPTDALAEGVHLRFDDSLQISYPKRPMGLFNSNASICDSLGNLLLYSNGCYVETADGIEVENSEGMNPGFLYNLFCSDNYGYGLSQSIVLLPDPGNPDLFHFFHIPLVAPSFVKNVLHTVVDMSANNGNGTTLFKNQIVATDTIHRHGIHAVRHANGRDWWIIAAKIYSNRYYLLLLTPDGVETKYQEIGPVDVGVVYGGEMVFSPDGCKVARFDTRDDLRIFDFDRCTGTLSNPVHIPIQDEADIEILAGLAWSADSRYIYTAEAQRLLQFDAWASDIAGSMVLVAEADPPLCPLSGSIGIMELGPDGMIYCSPFNGQKCLHRMKNPERAGTACAFEQNYFQLDYPFDGLPHFPNFRLGPIDGSPCDSLGIDNHPLANWRYDRTPGLGVDFTSVSWYEPTDWWWDFGDPGSGPANHSTEKHPAHTYTAAGPYEVCLTVSNQYGSDTKCKTVWVEQTTSLPGLPPAPSKRGGVTLWPNPTAGEVRWGGVEEGEEVTVQVHDALGRLCLQATTREGRADLGGLPEGIYFVSLINKQGKRIASKPILLH
ncbi:MAG: PKD domain-containing protein [Saprospiraceae bacterium]|nr:PKD domain-containing protein [Saprospiraceae bacterium]